MINGVSYVLKKDENIFAKATLTDDQSDNNLKNALQADVKKADFFILLILVLLIIVFIIMIYKLIISLSDNITVGICIGIMVILTGVMHRVWKEKNIAAYMEKILPLLDKKSRLVIVHEVLSNKKSFDFNLKNALKFLFGL